MDMHFTYHHLLPMRSRLLFGVFWCRAEWTRVVNASCVATYRTVPVLVTLIQREFFQRSAFFSEGRHFFLAEEKGTNEKEINLKLKTKRDQYWIKESVLFQDGCYGCGLHVSSSAWMCVCVCGCAVTFHSTLHFWLTDCDCHICFFSFCVLIL